MRWKIHEHPEAVKKSSTAAAVRYFVCPQCGRTDEIVPTRRILEDSDLQGAWFFDGLGYLSARASTRVMKCRACGELFRPSGAGGSWELLGIALGMGLLGAVVASSFDAYGPVKNYLAGAIDVAQQGLKDWPAAVVGGLSGLALGGLLALIWNSLRRRRMRRRWWERLHARDTVKRSPGAQPAAENEGPGQRG